MQLSRHRINRQGLIWTLDVYFRQAQYLNFNGQRDIILKLTSKGRYAVTAILDLAFHSRSGPVTLADISRRQDISLSYLEQLFTRLRKQQLVRSTRGPGGGYSLNRPANDIAVAEIVSAVDETVDTTRCSGANNCHEGQQCLAHELWDELSQQIYGFLDEISVKDLMEDSSIRDVADRQDRKVRESESMKVPSPE
jgi:Rrf2 family iron-sulfur cluster assembly transcriptional regulator